MLTSTLSKNAPFVDIPKTESRSRMPSSIPSAILSWCSTTICASSPRAAPSTKPFGWSVEDVRGHLLYEIDGGQWDIPELARAAWKRSQTDQATVEGYEVDREFPAIGQRVMLLNARKVFYEKGAHSTVLLAFEDITDRRAIERQVQDLLREKDMLLEEMQHRVANSLQIIASILLIKARTVQSEETRLQLEDAHQRVLSVAAVQQHLHVAGGGKPIEIGTYLTKLCETLAQSMIGDSRPISLKVDADAGTAISRDAVSLGLIVTELVMNALKHAFPGEKPDAAIVVSYKVAGTDWKLTISDNGIGKPDVERKPDQARARHQSCQSVDETARCSRGYRQRFPRHDRIHHARDIQIQTGQGG